MSKRESRIGRLTPKQLESFQKRQENGIPPWWKELNSNTTTDLNAHTIEEILARLDDALKVEGCPSRELLVIQSHARVCQLGWDRIRNATRQEPKHRKELMLQFRQVESLINALSNSTGFDLYEKATWGHAESSN